MIYNFLGLLMLTGLGTGLVGIWQGYQSKEKEATKLFKITSYIMIIVTVLALLVQGDYYERLYNFRNY